VDDDLERAAKEMKKLPKPKKPRKRKDGSGGGTP
jgi:hypothetical protein